MLGFATQAQEYQGFAFTRMTTEDGKGLASNDVLSLYQDPKGYMWVGTANGLQRFDGSKFIRLNVGGINAQPLPYAALAQIIPLDSVNLLLAFRNIHEFGIFNTRDFQYHRLALRNLNPINPRAEYQLWKGINREIYLNISQYGILKLNLLQLAFVENHAIHLPARWKPLANGVFVDNSKEQYWIPCDSGLAVFNHPTRETWTRSNNPTNLAILDNAYVQDGVTKFFIDHKRRHWIIAWPRYQAGLQVIHCLDSTGRVFLNEDTVGLNKGPVGYHEYHGFFESSRKAMWVYGSDLLFTYDNALQAFNYIRSGTDQININYETIHQLMEDRDGSIWIATDRGLYVTTSANTAFGLVNIIIDNKKTSTSITDITEIPNGDIWFSTWGGGIRMLDSALRPKSYNIYQPAPPDELGPLQQPNAKLTWSMCLDQSSENLWIGCQGGLLMIHNLASKQTRYVVVSEADQGTIRCIAKDKRGVMWLGTQNGRLIKYEQGSFRSIYNVGTIVYKVFVDKQGWLWIATHEKGIYAFDPVYGNMLQHYSSDGAANRLYSNTGTDIEQLNDSTIVYAAGVLNLINKRTHRIRWLGYEDGLPSNSALRLRMDHKGFLWIITTNGLCRYNPANDHITPYGRKDGIVVGEQTRDADFITRKGTLLFAGSNNVLIFDPLIFSNTQAPPNVSITDFKIFNNNLPVDSLMQREYVRLNYTQNSISIYFASLSFMQRDKLTYYYKLQGIDDDWIRADNAFYANYASLPPGRYTFSVYCENLEGVRSPDVTSIVLVIKPPFWRTGWFISSLIFVILVIIYDLHNARVKRLLAVEKLRNKVARDLHDDMGSTLSTINILASMAKTKMNTDTVKTSEFLGKISDNSQRMMEAMDDIVWSIKPSNDNMQRITARMREFAINVLEAKEVLLDFQVDERIYDVKLNMEKRRDFFLIFKEAINNTAKYAQAGHVHVNVSMKGKFIILSVKDDGIGFEKDPSIVLAAGGNGLGNMQKRAESMMGHLRIQSTKGNGTEVILRFPI
jgi:signal transduction histidine kinase/streptogramin lyase